MEKGNRLTDEEGKEHLEAGLLTGAIVIVVIALLKVFVAFKDYAIFNN